MNDRGLHDLGEDATGFGRMEARTVWEMLARPATVLEAYMSGGPTGHGQYTRPLRLYLALCGVMMVILFLIGGAGEMMLGDMPEEALAPLLEGSGKSRDAFMADADGWMSLVMVPLLSALYALASAPLLRWWDPEDLGWRKSFRATFAFLNAWTIPLIPFTWMAYDRRYAALSLALMIVLSIVAFLRTGKGRWYASTLEGVGKSLVMALAVMVAATLGSFPVVAIGILGGVMAP